MKEKSIKNINFNSLSKAEKIGQFFFPAAFINDSDLEIKEIERLIKEYNIGGLTFFHSRASAATNFEGKKKVIYNKNSKQRLKELIDHYQSIASTPLLIAIDAEWGLAMRVENTTQYPYAITLGAIPDDQDELIFEVGKHIGNDLEAMGIHLNLAPVVDINMNPDNPVIGYRSFGEDKIKVSQKAMAYYRGLKDAGILGCFKHFPGHGDTNIDSHLGLPVITKSKTELYDQELYPFIKAIEQEVDSIMIGHLAVPGINNSKDTSATLSKTIIKDLLRTKLGFDGTVISDALNMHSVSKLYPEKGILEWKAFNAGNDILCFSEHVEEGIQMIEKNASDEQIEESLRRIQKLKKNAFLKKEVKSSFNHQEKTSLIQNLAKASLTHYKEDFKNFSLFTSEEFEGILIGNNDNCTFFKEIEKNKQFNKINYSEEIAIEPATNNVLIALFPPHIKPANTFGIDKKIIQFIETISKTKNVALYLFGNPYVLNVLSIKSVNTIVLCHQDFGAFQHIAAQHFLKQHKAVGHSPVQL